MPSSSCSQLGLIAGMSDKERWPLAGLVPANPGGAECCECETGNHGGESDLVIRAAGSFLALVANAGTIRITEEQI